MQTCDRDGLPELPTSTDANVGKKIDCSATSDPCLGGKEILNPLASILSLNTLMIICIALSPQIIHPSSSICLYTLDTLDGMLTKQIGLNINLCSLAIKNSNYCCTG
jgi:hypothetical protein